MFAQDYLWLCKVDFKVKITQTNTLFDELKGRGMTCVNFELSPGLKGCTISSLYANTG